MPHQSSSLSSYESLQNTQHIAIEEPHASSNTTTGFKQTSSRTKPVVRHYGADAYDLSPSPPNFLILPLRAPVQPAHTAVGVSCYRPDGIIDSIVAPYAPSNSSRFPPSQPPVHSQLSIASPHVGPHQPKATLQRPTAVSQCPTTNQLQTDSQSAILTGGDLRQTGNLEDVSVTLRSSQLTVSLSDYVHYISAPIVVTISPTLTLNEIKGGAEVPRDSTSPASTLLSPVPSHTCGSALTG